MDTNERELIGISKIARQKVIERLKDAYAHDFLDADEFEKRLVLATNTKNRDTLGELVVDLPEEKQAINKKSEYAGEGLTIDKGDVKPFDKLVNVFGGISRKGKWRLPRKLKIISVMGGVDLDFSEAVMPSGIAEIELFSIMGGVELRIPEGINVDVECVAIMGGIKNHGFGNHFPGGPTIKITGFVLMGGVDVKPPRKNYIRKFIKHLFDE
jgi:hypothetical protein